jgi:mannose-6-phosphate isomerase-like protein (cupin superfamily)
MSQFELAPGLVSRAVVHGTVDELWYFLAGEGQMWRSSEDKTATVDVHPGVAISIPVGTRFQFRCKGPEPLQAIGITMPPWPGPEEATAVDGAWEPSL